MATMTKFKNGKPYRVQVKAVSMDNIKTPFHFIRLGKPVIRMGQQFDHVIQSVPKKELRLIVSSKEIQRFFFEDTVNCFSSLGLSFPHAEGVRDALYKHKKIYVSSDTGNMLYGGTIAYSVFLPFFKPVLKRAIKTKLPKNVGAVIVSGPGARSKTSPKKSPQLMDLLDKVNSIEDRLCNASAVLREVLLFVRTTVSSMNDDMKNLSEELKRAKEA